jgi:hypothetical protein
MSGLASTETISHQTQWHKSAGWDPRNLRDFPGLDVSGVDGEPGPGEWEVRDDAWIETRFHLRTGITSVVPWLVVPRRQQSRGS